VDDERCGNSALGIRSYAFVSEEGDGDSTESADDSVDGEGGTTSGVDSDVDKI
jgi:hypothetical protein